MNCQSSIPNDPGHRKRIDRIVARYGDEARTVRHYDVLALADYPKACLLECLDRFEMIDAGEPGHS